MRRFLPRTGRDAGRLFMWFVLYTLAWVGLGTLFGVETSLWRAMSYAAAMLLVAKWRRGEPEPNEAEPQEA